MDLKQILKKIAEDPNISDLHLTINMPPMIRYNGGLTALKNYDRIDFTTLKEVGNLLMDESQIKELKQQREMDFSYSYPGVARFRVNAFYQRGTIAFALRIIPHTVKTIEQLGLPMVVKKLSKLKTGLILCTGPTGSGKSTTLAAMLDSINRERKLHIITLEDPIEYLHRNQESVVHQREINQDSLSFAKALRAALRQDPDIILVGEMRDLETIHIALEAAETGHLVMATLHTNDAPQAIDRIIDVFPPHQQNQVKVQLSAVLQGVLAHQLIPRQDRSSRIMALEVLTANSAVKNLIREGKTHQLYSVMQSGGQLGMQTMDFALLRLYEQGVITFDDAVERALNPNYIQKKRSNY